MSSWLSEREQRLVAGAEAVSAATPIPTQIVSNGEYLPPPQSETQKRVEQRMLEMADVSSKRLGLSRRQFMQTSCGMAAAFLAMNEIYGNDPGRGGRGARAGANAGAGAEFGWTVCFRRPDSFRSRRFQARGASGLGRFRKRALEPEDEGRGRVVPRPLQVPELREGDLLR